MCVREREGGERENCVIGKGNRVIFRHLLLQADAMYKLLSSDYLNVRHEEVVFEAICKWIRHHPATRMSEMPRMLRGVRLGFLSTKYLIERIKSHEYVRSSDEAKLVVVEALKCVCNLEMNDTSRVGPSR